MTGYRTRNRPNSIFSDDERGEDRWPEARWRREDYGWGGNPRRDEPTRRDAASDRNFLERAGDEVRSWFGDDEAERRRERDAREGGKENSGGQWRSNQGARPASAPADHDRGHRADRERGTEQHFAGHHDETYRRWRDEQIATLDREYDEYRRHRQRQFEQDFSTFRQNRLTDGGTVPGGQAAQVSTGPASTFGAGQQNSAELTTGHETVTAEPAGETGGRPIRNR